ncbi:MAG: hypothetical protein NTV80_06050, partial [Verrucomicrobia bacterium]|nr:hypothetical protein [Verrucomicrobiota bacterium]
TRIGPTDSPLPVSIQLSGNATNGLDISSISLNQIIPINETTLTLPIIPLPDSLSEGDETLTLTLLPTLDYQPTAPLAADLLITDRHLGYWKQNMFGQNANNPLIAGDDADPDRDGLANLLEYALGRLPLTPEPPQQGIQHDLHLGQQRLTLTRDPQATDVLLQIQRSPTLNAGTWNATNLILDQNTATLLQARDTTPLNTRSFLRAMATPAP